MLMDKSVINTASTSQNHQVGEENKPSNTLRKLTTVIISFQQHKRWLGQCCQSAAAAAWTIGSWQNSFFSSCDSRCVRNKSFLESIDRWVVAPLMTTLSESMNTEHRYLLCWCYRLMSRRLLLRTETSLKFAQSDHPHLCKQTDLAWASHRQPHPPTLVTNHYNRTCSSGASRGKGK